MKTKTAAAVLVAAATVANVQAHSGGELREELVGRWLPKTTWVKVVSPQRLHMERLPGLGVHVIWSETGSCGPVAHGRRQPDPEQACRIAIFVREPGEGLVRTDLTTYGYEHASSEWRTTLPRAGADYVAVMAYPWGGEGRTGTAITVYAHAHYTPDTAWREVAFVPLMPRARAEGQPDHFLRLVPRGDAPLTVRVSGVDDAGAAFDGWETALAPPAPLKVEMRTIEAAIGDGEGAWALTVEATGDVSVVAVMRDGDGREVLPVE